MDSWFICPECKEWALHTYLEGDRFCMRCGVLLPPKKKTEFRGCDGYFKKDSEECYRNYAVCKGRKCKAVARGKRRERKNPEEETRWPDGWPVTMRPFWPKPPQDQQCNWRYVVAEISKKRKKK